jgi:hypothetical protein
MRAVAILIILVIGVPAQAEVTCPYEGSEKAQAGKSGLLCLDGTLGMWFPAKKGRELLKAVVKLKACEKKSSAQKELISLEEAGKKAVQALMNLEAQRTALWRETAEDAIHKLSKMSPPVFYKDPWFWASAAMLAVSLVSVSR